MKKFTLFALLLGMALSANAQEKEKVDLNHRDVGGYGYTVSTADNINVWWAEGLYKVMQDAPLPTKKKNEIAIKAAKNEFESFIVVVNPKHDVNDFEIEVDDLEMKKGSQEISDKNITIRKVEHVQVNIPTDYYSEVGMYPDPLPLVGEQTKLTANQNNAFWVTVKVPSGATAGDYTSKVTLKAEQSDWEVEIPLNLKVWNFELPKEATMRSGFGIDMNNIIRYNNITEQEDQEAAFEKHMQAFRDYKISPYDPFRFSPIKETITGVEWDGGFYDSKNAEAGKYSFMVVDRSRTENVEATTRELIAVEQGASYSLSWDNKSQSPKQTYVVGVECYDKDKKLLNFENKFEQFSADTLWGEKKFELGKFNDRIAYVKIYLCPSNRTASGEDIGTVWFDNVELVNKATQKNLLTAGDFEVDIDKISIELDFTDFNLAAKKYLHDYGFNSYRLTLKGLGGGTYYSTTRGVFEGFEQGTEEYNKLMKGYLMQVQNNLEKEGILGKEYIYWFDEPSEKDYAFVYETNKMIKEYAPKLTTFLTEHITGQDISDVTDISCTIWHKLNHDKIRGMNEKGLEYWSYLCVWPKAPWLSEFIDHDAVNLRMWLWASYVHDLTGILIWQTTYWNSSAASQVGYLQNPWEEAMSFVNGYGWPLGKQTVWGNGDGRLFYPENRDVNGSKKKYSGEPIPSIRMENVRDGIEDYEYLVILEQLAGETKNRSLKNRAEKLLKIPTSLYTNETTYSKDPQTILQYRDEVGELIERMSK